MNTKPTHIHQYNAEDFGLSPDLIPSQALNVVETLKNAGYQTYIVGGSVRDLLLGDKPKDYDIATDARPEQIIKCFRKCRVIGRRFKIVHVGFGRNKIEVSTFRASPNPGANSGRTATKDGLLIRDNQYGSRIEEDILRRDFTINAMYYDPYAAKLVCHKSALDDIKQRRLRFIGPARERCREDPVRMLRALRLAAKNNLAMSKEIKQSVFSLGGLLRNVSPMRLFEENIKWMHSGSAHQHWDLFQEYGFVKILFPIVDDYLIHDSDGNHRKLLDILFRNTDERIAQNKPVNPAFTFSVMLWPAIQTRQQALINHGNNADFALRSAYDEVMSAQREYTEIPYGLVKTGIDICMLQLQLTSKHRKHVYAAFEHPKFRAAYDLLCFRETANLSEPGPAQWWTRIQEMDAKGQQKMINERTHTKRFPRKRTSRRSAYAKSE